MPLSTEKSEYLIVGDLHGCYYTFKEILRNWNHEKELLICVGDYVGKGNNTSLLLDYLEEIDHNFPGSSHIFLKGNHDEALKDHLEGNGPANWVLKCGNDIISDFKKHDRDFIKTKNWLSDLPLTFEVGNLMVSHGGISETKNYLDTKSSTGILLNRNPLINIGKLQVHGHKALRSKFTLYDQNANSYNIDTGACYGIGLTALKVNELSEIVTTFFVPTNPKDFNKTKEE